MKARLVPIIAVVGLTLAVAVEALAEPPVNPPTPVTPGSGEEFQAGTQITFRASTAPTAPTEMDFYISRSPDTNAKGVLFRSVDIIGGGLESGAPATGTVHAADWPGEQPGSYFWQAVYIDCVQDTDCFNQSPARPFTINPLPASAVKSAAQIETFLDHHPRHRTRQRRVRFDFSSNVAGATFRCLFAQGWADCESPHIFRHLKLGRFKFEVRAAVNGLEDPTPASWTFRVLRRNPQRNQQNR